MANSRNTRSALLLLLMAGPVPASGHKDEPLRIDANGAIHGLPPQYSPARIEVLRSDGGSVPRVWFVVPNARYEFPVCISRLFDLPQGERLRASASWYHGFETLPPYMLLHLPQKSYGEDCAYHDGYELLMTLDTAEIVWLERTSVQPYCRLKAMEQVDLAKACPPNADLRIWSPPKATTKRKKSGGR